MNATALRISLVTMTVLVVGAGLAWACTPHGVIVAYPGAADPGATVRIQGGGFEDKNVEVRMGSASGPLLGTAQGPEFSLTVTIPEMAPDISLLVAVGRNADGSVAGDDSTPFEVTGSRAAPAGPSAGGAPASAGSGPASNGTVSEQARSEPQAQSETPTRSSQQDRQRRAAAPARSRQRTGARSDRGARRARGETGDRTSTRRTTGSLPPTVVTTRSGRRVFGDSAAPTRSANASARTARRAARPGSSAQAARSAPATRTPRPGTAARDRSPSLTGPADMAPQDAPRDARFVAGAALLGLGLVTLLGGFLVAEARRRRAPSASPRRGPRAG